MDNTSSSIKTYMAITAERDSAIRDRNMALEERKRAFAERDMAMLQRDAAIAERNSALKERDDAIAALQDTECSIHNMFSDSAIDDIADEAKELLYLEQIRYDIPDGAFSPIETSTSHTPSVAEADYEAAKISKVKHEQEDGITNSSRSAKTSKRQAEGMSEHMIPHSSNGWSSSHNLETDEEIDGQIVTWKEDLGMDQINFDETSMPVPVCSCTGTPQPCYKWGSGGWQSACCTTTMSMYPLPQVSNKRYTRVGGRKMSGSAFNKLLSRLAAEGKYLYSGPLDLKDHWAKHGTNRYSTLK